MYPLGTIFGIFFEPQESRRPVNTFKLKKTESDNESDFPLSVLAALLKLLYIVGNNQENNLSMYNVPKTDRFHKTRILL